MALADTMVVMNHGIIEQVGSPHAIYNRPLNEFVARFMGGHNIVQTSSGKIGVRTDQIQVHPTGSTNAADNTRPAVISNVEYQGTYVLLGLHAPGASQTTQSSADYAVMLPEAQFSKRPFAMGESVQLSWAPEMAHALAA